MPMGKGIEFGDISGDIGDIIGGIDDIIPLLGIKYSQGGNKSFPRRE